MLSSIAALALAILMIVPLSATTTQTPTDSVATTDSTATITDPYFYDFSFEQPYKDCIESTSCKPAGGKPYVNPDGSAAATKYYLSPKRRTDAVATNIIEKENGSKAYFTYTPEYADADADLCLSAYPAATDFIAYTISGTWMP